MFNFVLQGTVKTQTILDVYTIQCTVHSTVNQIFNQNGHTFEILTVQVIHEVLVPREVLTSEHGDLHVQAEIVGVHHLCNNKISRIRKTCEFRL